MSSIIVEYKESGTKAWRVIIAPVQILFKIAKAVGRPIIGRNGKMPPHITLPIKKLYSNNDDD